MSKPEWRRHDRVRCGNALNSHSDPEWQIGVLESLEGADPDGSAGLLQLLDGDPVRYQAWAGEYFETPVARWAVDHIFAHHPLTEDVVRGLNPGLTLADLAGDIAEIAYPNRA